MSYRSSGDLVYEALEKLGIVATGNPPSVEDTARVSEALESIFEQLAAEEIVQVPDPNNIPGAWFMSLAKIVAYECREKFGITGDEAAGLETANVKARMTLKAMLRGRPTYEPLRADWL